MTVRKPCIGLVASLVLALWAHLLGAQQPSRPVPALVQESLRLLQANQPQQALPLLERAVSLDPNNADARAALGQVLIDLGQPDKALPHLHAAVRLRPIDSPSVFNLGVAQFDTGHTAQAFETLARLAGREPGEWATRSYLARAALRLKRTDVARSNLLALRQMAPNEVLLHAQLVEWCFQEEAGTLTRDQIEFTLERPLPPPREARVRYLSGLLYWRAHNSREAVTDFARAVMLDAREEYYVALFKVQAAGGNDKLDKSLLESALQKYPDSRELAITEALLKMSSSHVDEALQSAKRLVEKYPQSADVYILSGRIHLGDLSYDLAQTDLERAVALDAKNAEAWYYLAVCRLRLDKEAPAQSAFEKATSLNSAYTEAWLDYGRLLYDRGAYQQASPAFATVIKLAPGMAVAYNLMSQTQRKLGKPEEAARYLAQFKRLSAPTTSRQ